MKIAPRNGTGPLRLAWRHCTRAGSAHLGATISGGTCGCVQLAVQTVQNIAIIRDLATIWPWMPWMPWNSGHFSNHQKRIKPRATCFADTAGRNIFGTKHAPGYGEAHTALASVGGAWLVRSVGPGGGSTSELRDDEVQLKVFSKVERDVS